MVNMKFYYPNKTRDDFLKDVVIQLIFRRLELGISQEELNYKLGIADRLVNKWECGTRTPIAFHLYCWADALDGKIVFVPNNSESISWKHATAGIASNDNEKSDEKVNYLPLDKVKQS